MKILIVDDDLLFADMLSGVVSAWGHTVRTAHSIAEGVLALDGESFDLTLMDIYLPDGLGSELIRRMVEQGSDMGVITMTANNSRDMELSVRQMKVLHHLVKPFSHTVLKTILEHIERKQQQRALSGQERHV